MSYGDKPLDFLRVGFMVYRKRRNVQWGDETIGFVLGVLAMKAGGEIVMGRETHDELPTGILAVSFYGPYTRIQYAPTGVESHALDNGPYAALAAIAYQHGDPILIHDREVRALPDGRCEIAPLVGGSQVVRWVRSNILLRRHEDVDLMARLERQGGSS